MRNYLPFTLARALVFDDPDISDFAATSFLEELVDLCLCGLDVQSIHQDSGVLALGLLLLFFYTWSKTR